MESAETPSDDEVKRLRREVDLHPTDLQRRFELGVALFRRRRYVEAIVELQKAQGDPHRRIEAMRLLADCYEARRLFDLAERVRKNIARESGEDSDEGSAPVPVPKPPVTPPGSFRAERRFDEDDRAA
jgi:Flp pilus assembly protein TadD